MSEETKMYMAYDFFDTLVHRNVAPEVTIYEWSKKISLRMDYLVSPSVVYEIRKKAEIDGKLLFNKEEITYEQLMGLVYERCLKSLERGRQREFAKCVSKEEFLALAHTYEVETELLHLSVDVKRKKELAYYQKKGTEMILISDFYAGREFFREILARLGLSGYFSYMFISSEAGVRKSSGALYEYVKKELGIDGSQLVMHGDNRLSDVDIPKKMGIPSVHCANVSKKYRDYQERELQKAMFHLSFHQENAPLNGYLGELLYFTSKLHHKLIQNHVKRVYFCSREGQLLKRFFDMYQNAFAKNRKIQTVYLYVSRKATMLPSLDSFEIETFSRIFRQYDALSPMDFLKSLSFTEEEIKTVTKGFRESLEEKSVTKELDCAFIQELKESPEFTELYDKKRREQKELFMNQFRQCGETFKDGIHLVDIGWKGTIQDNISQILGDVKVYGYYLGMMVSDYPTVSVERKEGILFQDIGEPCKNYHLLKRNYLFYERMLCANHGPVCGYAMDDDKKTVPVIDNREEELSLYAFLKEYQERLITGFGRMIQVFARSKWLPYERYDAMVKCSLYKQCVHLPKIWKVEKEARNQVMENFGQISDNQNKKACRIGKEQLEKVDYLFVDYVFRGIDKLHLSKLSFVGDAYCKSVYALKSLTAGKHE